MGPFTAAIAAELVVLVAIVVSAGIVVNGHTIWGALAAAVLP